ncbi:YceD family protein [Streptantibioticus ferralitis]|uniref:YceD family protein n=1 Tax=Streptantibioticus ferralitis TaxID=236510 RepID=A0ABT5YRH6_9ACTN|nr:YceD family protein [Streptantibioticus ferralitis]MDF2254201.1 YceD family protein [Streptantibioticus ferralitis]
MNARLDHRDPLVFDTRELGRRPGAMKRVSRTVPAPADLGIAGVIGVPEGASIELDLRLESVMEGVLVTGTAHALVAGECVRCLESIEWELDSDFQELYSYPDADERFGGNAEEAEDGDEEELLVLEDDMFDLESVLRDAVVLELPLQPVCREDCPGLCSDCGARLADDPEHHHDAADIRWAALQGLADSLKAGEKDNMGGAERGVDEKQEK